jgi:hypothetical protein
MMIMNFIVGGFCLLMIAIGGVAGSVADWRGSASQWWSAQVMGVLLACALALAQWAPLAQGGWPPSQDNLTVLYYGIAFAWIGGALWIAVGIAGGLLGLALRRMVGRLA